MSESGTMRQLHPVGWHEKFVASGVYIEIVSGGPVGDSEQWTIHELPDGSQIVRADTDKSREHGVVILTELLRGSEITGRQIERIDLQAYTTVDKAISDYKFDEARAKYTFFDSSVHVTRTIDGVDQVPDVIALPDEYFLDLEAWITHGINVRRLATKNVSTPVFTINEADFKLLQRHRYNSAKDELWHFKILGQETYTIQNQNYAAMRCECWHPNANEREYFWFRMLVDDHEIMLSFADTEPYEAKLTQYVRRPEPSRS
jgi:hypothetical protein